MVTFIYLFMILQFAWDLAERARLCSVQHWLAWLICRGSTGTGGSSSLTVVPSAEMASELMLAVDGELSWDSQ